MHNEIRKLTTMLAAAGMLSVAACGHSNNQNSAGDVGTPAAQTPATSQSPSYGTSAATPDTTTYEHHSKLKGAIVGAAVGHMAGHHALAGAAAGALVQHERNKHH